MSTNGQWSARSLSRQLLEEKALSAPTSPQSTASIQPVNLVQTLPLDLTKERENEPLMRILVGTAPLYLAQRLSKNGRFLLCFI